MGSQQAPWADTHVVVVGAGPVGMMCAAKLSKAGIRVTVIEKDHEIPPIPKALTYTAPVLADLAKLGILEDVAKISFADEQAIWQWRKLDGTILADMHWSLLASDPNPRLHKPYALQCGQHLLAKVLTEYFLKYPNTKVLFDHELVALEQDGEGVTLQVERNAEGGESGSGGKRERFEIKADWVIGADGGKSTTRKLIHQSLDGFTWDESFVAMNVRFPFMKYGWGAANFLIGGKDWAVAGRTGPGGDPWRVAYGVEPGLTDEQVLEQAPKYLKRILPGDDKYEIIHCAQYKVHQRQVQEYKIGRVILAGDAAHLNNPIGGFGLTTGITDAGCLSDALALVIRGEASEALLQKACDVRKRIFAEVSNPGSQNFKRIVQQDPNHVAEADLEFFKKLNEDRVFQKNALLGTLKLFTPIEDIAEELEADGK